MSVSVQLERSGVAVRDALQGVSPAEADLFETEFRDALLRASETLDLLAAEQVLTRWWGIAHLRLQPPTDEEREAMRRLHAGEDVGWTSAEDYLASKSA